MILRDSKLDLGIKIDPTSQLPLLSEVDKILEFITAYVHLPYSAIEYGCGKRASIIINQLRRIGVSHHAMARGMIIEKDLSEEMLAIEDPLKRPGALLAKNPFYKLIDFDDVKLLRKIQNDETFIDLDTKTIKVRQYELSHSPEVQFLFSRSHIFPLISFWDEEKLQILDLALDPSLDPHRMFPPKEMRAMFNAPEAVILLAKIPDRFLLVERFFTDKQKQEIDSYLQGRSLESLTTEEEIETIRRFLNNPPLGSIGDPATWTYANNIDGFYKPNPSLAEQKHLAIQEKVTEIELTTDQMVNDQIIKDAQWSEEQLEPLTRILNIAARHMSVGKIIHHLRQNKNDIGSLQDENLHEYFYGIGLSLRERIERLAKPSVNPEGMIDARTLNKQFNKAAIELIRQMNKAGMLVFVDEVANIHGFLLSEKDIDAYFSGAKPIEEFSKKALCFHSHIDTVLDAGKYDGRLGVLSGVEIAHLINNLRLEKDLAIDEKLDAVPIMVTAFINEEMSFTGESVSMPGSSAVAGLAETSRIYKMQNAHAELYGDQLKVFIKDIQNSVDAGDIVLAHDLDWPPEPQRFFPRQLVERHSEQAESLLRAKVPVIQADAIMGIYQEDFYISGRRAEKAAFVLIDEMRKIQEDGLQSIRVTNGVLEHLADLEKVEEIKFAVTYKIKGERNHAGATSLENRVDPGVAAAKLIDKFFDLCHEFELTPKVGSTALVPGMSRNVISGDAYVSLAVQEEEIDPEIWKNIKVRLRSLLLELINRDLFSWQNETVAEMQFSSKLRLSLDLRSGREEERDLFLEKLEPVISSLEKEFDVEIERSLEQVLAPVRLDEVGTAALFMDQSVGGSHNPNEAEHNQVILLGTLLQFLLCWKLFESPDKKVYDLINEILPDDWQKSMGSFCSGALHDTCNIVKGMKAKVN